jgi:DNA replication protein DnaC
MTRIEQYYQIPKFKEWIVSNEFKLFKEENIHVYYTVFQQQQMCEEKRCTECAGEKIEFKTEADIISQQLTSTRCFVPFENAKQQQAKQLAKSVIIPPAYKHITWSNVTILEKTKEGIIGFISKFPDKDKPGLFIYSDKRGGKTSILWLILQDLIIQNKIFQGFILQSAPMFLSNLRQGEFSGDGVNYLFEKAVTCDILLLDDFGREKHTPQMQNRLFTIIDERSMYKLPIVYASSFEPDPMLWSEPFENDLMQRILENSNTINIDTGVINAQFGNNPNN